MRELRNQNIWLVPRSVANNWCVLSRVKAKKEIKNVQQRTLSSFITIPTMLQVYGQLAQEHDTPPAV